MKIIEDIKPRGIASICIEDTPFDRSLKKLKSKGFEIIPLWQNALLREQEGYESFIAQNTNWVKEGVLYISEKNIILLKKSLCLNNPKIATLSHRYKKEYTEISKEEIEKAREEGIKIKRGDLNKSGPFSDCDILFIPVKRLGSSEYGVFLFGGEGTDEEKSKRAQTYGEWLINSQQEIEKIDLCLNNKNYISNMICKPYANQLLFTNLAGGSALYGNERFLGYKNRVRGVKDITDSIWRRK